LINVVLKYRIVAKQYPSWSNWESTVTVTRKDVFDEYVSSHWNHLSRPVEILSATAWWHTAPCGQILSTFLWPRLEDFRKIHFTSHASHVWV